MKALATLLLSSLMLISCGKLETRQSTTDGALQGLSENGAISQEDANNIDESLLNETIEMTEASSSSILMKIGGAELLVDFVQNLTGATDEVAMIINGIEVTREVATNPQSLQGLIATLVSSKIDGKEIFGLPLMDLVNMGLDLVTGDAKQANFSNLFGTIVRGALNMFMSSSPIGAIIGAIAGPILGNNSNQNQSNPSGGGLGNIVNTIGGAISGGNSTSQFGGILSLIMNLFK